MPPPNVPLYKKILSYIYPVRVQHTQGSAGQLLEVYLYAGQWQLATTDALYSDGNRYRPIVAAFKILKGRLPSVRSVLVLGTGLGSAVKILNDRGYYPSITLVDVDEQVLKLALDFCTDAAIVNITPVCADAAKFAAKCKDTFDMVIVDIFNGRQVPGFVTTKEFLENSRRLLTSNGCLIFNYIINNEKEWLTAKGIFDQVFPENHVIGIDVNRILIATFHEKISAKL